VDLFDDNLADGGGCACEWRGLVAEEEDVELRWCCGGPASCKRGSPIAGSYGEALELGAPLPDSARPLMPGTLLGEWWSEIDGERVIDSEGRAYGWVIPFTAPRIVRVFIGRDELPDELVGPNPPPPPPPPPAPAPALLLWCAPPPEDDEEATLWGMWGGWKVAPLWWLCVCKEYGSCAATAAAAVFMKGALFCMVDWKEYGSVDGSGDIGLCDSLSIAEEYPDETDPWFCIIACCTPPPPPGAPK
jgi:hypothetical protein